MNYTEDDFTPWFDGKVKPAYPGVYQQYSGLGIDEIGYQYYDGYSWYAWHSTPEGALHGYSFGNKAYESFQNDQWRGLKTKPEKYPYSSINL